MVTTCFYGIHLTFSLLIFEQKVVRLLISEVKSHSCRETGQSGQVPLILLDKPKALIPTNDVSEKKSCSFLLSNRKQVQTLTKVSNKIQLIKRFRLFLFLAVEDLSAEEVKEAEVFSWWNFGRIFCLF